MIKNTVKIMTILWGINLVLLLPTAFFLILLEKISDTNVKVMLFLTLAYSLIPLILYYIAALKFVHSQNLKSIILSLTFVFIIWVGLFFTPKTDATTLLVYPFIPIVIAADNIWGVSQSVSFLLSMLISLISIICGTMRTKTKGDVPFLSPFD